MAPGSRRLTASPYAALGLHAGFAVCLSVCLCAGKHPCTGAPQVHRAADVIGQGGGGPRGVSWGHGPGPSGAQQPTSRPGCSLLTSGCCCCCCLCPGCWWRWPVSQEFRFRIYPLTHPSPGPWQAVGGHSYGAFMTANLLSHAPELFSCGIARSGAYNRTFTPFGFQNEERTIWQARRGGRGEGLQLPPVLPASPAVEDSPVPAYLFPFPLSIQTPRIRLPRARRGRRT